MLFVMIPAPLDTYTYRLAVVDFQPRPAGLSLEETQTLQQLGRLAVDALVQHRQIVQQRAQLDHASRLLAMASHELLTPLSAIQLSLALLLSREEQDDAEEDEHKANASNSNNDGNHYEDLDRDGEKWFPNNLSDHQKECLNTIRQCSATMGTICASLRPTLSSVSSHHDDSMLRRVLVMTTAPSQQQTPLSHYAPTQLAATETEAAAAMDGIGSKKKRSSVSLLNSNHTNNNNHHHNNNKKKKAKPIHDDDDDDHNARWIPSTATAAASWAASSPIVSPSSSNSGNSFHNHNNMPPPVSIRQSLSSTTPSSSSSAFLSGSVSSLHQENNETDLGDRGTICHIPLLVAKLNQVMATTPKQVPLIFFVDPLVPCTVRLLPSTSHQQSDSSNSDCNSSSRRQEQRMNEKQVFHQALQLLLHSCQRTTSGSVRFTVRLGHCRCEEDNEKSQKHRLLESSSSPSSSSLQQEVLIIECEDTGPAPEPDVDMWMDQPKPPASMTTIVAAAAATTTNATATENSNAAALSSSSVATGPGCVLNCLPSPTTSPSALGGGGGGSASTRLLVGPATAALAASSLSLAPVMALTDPCLWLGSPERTTSTAALSLSEGGNPDAAERWHNEEVHVETKVDDEADVKTRFWFTVPIETNDRVMQQQQQLREQQPEVQAEHGTKWGRDRDGIRKRRREEDGMSLPSSDTLTSILDSKGRSNRKTALVIDDSTVVRKVLARALSQLGYETCQAVNGMEGLKQMQSSKFDLVLCDFLMPVMDGMDCVREYRKWEGCHRPGYRQYIVGMSAHASGNDVHRGLSIGMNAYRPKPVSFEDLRLLQGEGFEELVDAVKEQDNYTASGTSSPSLTAGMMHARSESRCILSLAPQVERVCLIATSDEKVAELVKAAARDQGWHAITARNGEEALNLMKKRNWGAVLLDSDTAELSGLSCVSRFRVWEKQNRVHRQKNVHLLTSGLTSCTRLHGYLSELQLPMGVDAALGKPVLKEEVKQALMSCEGKSVSFAARDIVTR